MFRFRMMVLILLGISVVAVTLLTAARNQTEPLVVPETKTSTATMGSQGFICLGIVDTELQRLAVFPNCFPQPAKISKILKKEFDTVVKGEVIAELDTVLFNLTIQEAESGIDEADALIGQANQALAAHKVAIAAQKSLIEAKEFNIEAKKSEMKQLIKLKEKNYPQAAEQLEAAENGIKGLEKEVEAETRKLKGLEQIQPTTKLDQARAGKSRAQLKLQQAQYALKQMVYTAPVDGTIIRSSLYEGMVIAPGMHQEPISLQPKGKLFVRTDVLQEYAHRVTMNQKVSIVDHTNSKLNWTGKVIRIASSLQPKRSNSSAIELFSSNDDPVLEVWVEIEMKKDAPPVTLGERMRVTFAGS